MTVSATEFDLGHLTAALVRSEYLPIRECRADHDVQIAERGRRYQVMSEVGPDLRIIREGDVHDHVGRIERDNEPP